MSLSQIENHIEALDPVIKYRRRFGIVLQSGRGLLSQRDFARAVLAGHEPASRRSFSQTDISQMERGARLPPAPPPSPDYQWLFDRLGETMAFQLRLESDYLKRWLIYAAQVEYFLHNLDSVVDLRAPFGNILTEVCQHIAGGATSETQNEWRFGSEAVSNPQTLVLYHILCTGWARAQVHEEDARQQGHKLTEGRYWNTKGGDTYTENTRERLRSVVGEGLKWEAVTRWARVAYGADLADCFVHLNARLSLGGGEQPLKIVVETELPAFLEKTGRRHGSVLVAESSR